MKKDDKINVTSYLGIRDGAVNRISKHLIGLCYSVMELQCPASSCEFKTPKMGSKEAMEYLTLHNSHAHAVQPVQHHPSSKAESLKRPEITHDASESTWRDFELQWKRYKRSTGISGCDVIDQLISCCSSTLRLDLNSEHGDGLNNLTEQQLLDCIKSLAILITIPMVHRNKMRQLHQGENELFKNFLARLKEAAIDCEFDIKCSKASCNAKSSYAEQMIRDQAIYGLSCSDAQAKILAAGFNLPTLDDVKRIAEAEEQAMQAQEKLKTNAPAQASARRNQMAKPNLGQQACIYCGKAGHGKQPGRETRKRSCSAWGQTCQHCKKIGHIDVVCRAKTASTSQCAENGEHSAVTSAVFGPLVANITTVRQRPTVKAIEHLEWSEDRGWHKASPTKMPQIRLHIGVMNLLGPVYI